MYNTERKRRLRELAGEAQGYQDGGIPGLGLGTAQGGMSPMSGGMQGGMSLAQPNPMEQFAMPEQKPLMTRQPQAEPPTPKGLDIFSKKIGDRQLEDSLTGNVEAKIPFRPEDKKYEEDQVEVPMRREEAVVKKSTSKKEKVPKKEDNKLEGLGSDLSKIGDAFQAPDVKDTAQYGVDPSLYKAQDIMGARRAALMDVIKGR